MSGEGIEPSTAEREFESPASTAPLMEEVCERKNLKKGLKRVRSNKGSPGIDGMTVDELPGYLKERRPTHREQLLILRLARASEIGVTEDRLTYRTAGYGPVRTVV